ncbi:MAG: formylglycine-generating enzyme family protein [Chitinispirillales bacterium]|jgi:formylglycine-generating enzyme required for sulfatase activity|nr:formylglycine-generating enzyme family protein [Chitinispirillales bacterium]
MSICPTCSKELNDNAKSCSVCSSGNSSKGSGNDQGDNVNIKMVFVEGGTFVMGAGDDEQAEGYSIDNEKPAHSVTVDDFYIGKYLITQKEWQKVMGINITAHRDKVAPEVLLRGVGDDNPMYFVTWDNIQEFISKLNSMTGKIYRLLTEAEWEYAARGGIKSKKYKYAGNDNIDDVAWYNVNSGVGNLNGDKWTYEYTMSYPEQYNELLGCNKSSTHPVGSKKPNELGIYDMSGNVFEWVSDWSGNYNPSPQINPTGAPSGTLGIIRGGSWANHKTHCRLSSRYFFLPTVPYATIGFRLALSSSSNKKGCENN